MDETGYYVEGAVYTDENHDKVADGHKLWNLGPFRSEETARLVWRALVLDWSDEMHAFFVINHSSHESYWIVGGRYKDTGFSQIDGGEEERFGPYHDYQEARDVWRSKSLMHMDDCMVRYRIEKNQ